VKNYWQLAYRIRGAEGSGMVRKRVLRRSTRATYKICLSVTSDFYRLHYFLSASATSPRYRCSASMSASDDYNLYLLDVYTECRDMSASVVLFVGT
jgi:hypothetical protein